jgi:hypothetical protein
MNSGSCDKMQAFSRVFMHSECVARWSGLLPPYAAAGIPTSGTVHGPEQFVHLMLGCWIVFPDMVVTKIASWITPSSATPGRSSLTIDVNIVATKTAFLACDLWLPPAVDLPSLYEVHTAMQLQTLAHLFPPSYAGKEPPIFFSSTSAPHDSDYVVISESFIQALYQCALPIHQPVSIQLKGQFCFDFDEQNRVTQFSFFAVLI